MRRRVALETMGWHPMSKDATVALVIHCLPTGEISVAEMTERGMKRRHLAHSEEQALSHIREWFAKVKPKA